MDFLQHKLPAHCEPASPALENLSRFFASCFPSWLSVLSSVFGTLSIAAWLCAQMPQIWKNYTRKSVTGLSLGFLGIWLAGDICNLLGAIWTGQMWFQMVVGAYYVTVDCILVSQFLYYGGRETYIVETQGYAPVDGTDEGSDSDSGSSKYKAKRSSSRRTRSAGSTLIVVVSVLLHVAGAAPTTGSPAFRVQEAYSPTLVAVGGVLSWASTIAYLLSRLPQIFLNMRRKTTSGLSITLFVAAFFGNFFYSASLLTNPLGLYDYPPYGGGGLADGEGNDHLEWWGRTLPFFLGAAGVLALDATVACQFMWWGEQPELPDHMQKWAWEGLSDRLVAPSGWGGGWWPWSSWWSRETQPLLQEARGRSYGAANEHAREGI